MMPSASLPAPARNRPASPAARTSPAGAAIRNSDELSGQGRGRPAGFAAIAAARAAAGRPAQPAAYPCPNPRFPPRAPSTRSPHRPARPPPPAGPGQAVRAAARGAARAARAVRTAAAGQSLRAGSAVRHRDAAGRERRGRQGGAVGRGRCGRLRRLGGRPLPHRRQEQRRRPARLLGAVPHVLQRRLLVLPTTRRSAASATRPASSARTPATAHRAVRPGHEPAPALSDVDDWLRKDAKATLGQLKG